MTQTPQLKQPRKRIRVILRSWLCLFHGTVKEIQAWSVLLTAIALIFAIYQFGIEYSDRMKERRVGAWQILAMNVPGTTGKRDALEYLNAESGSFCFEWLRGNLDWLHEDENDVSCMFLFKSRSVLYGVELSQPHVQTLELCRQVRRCVLAED